MSVAYLIIGANENDRLSNIYKARYFINKDIGTIQQSSSLYETEPWGFICNCNFYNQVVRIDTSLNHYDVLNEIKKTEERMGRKRTAERYSSRIIDIDILFFDHVILESGNLVIPHPGIADRRFVLEPMREIAKTFVHPKLHKSMDQLYDECNDKSKVWKINSNLPDIQE